MFQLIQGLFRWFAESWCNVVHPDPMWPISGRYRCPACYRTYPVPWANTGATESNVTAGRVQPAPALARKLLAGHPGMNQAQ